MNLHKQKKSKTKANSKPNSCKKKQRDYEKYNNNKLEDLFSFFKETQNIIVQI